MNQWIRDWLNEWAVYLDSPASINGIPTWSDVVDLSTDSEYVIPDGGFQSFNDFFGRSLKPGTRPIGDAGIVSPCDCILDYAIHDISVNDPEQRFMVKDVEFNVLQILDNDERAARYEGGVLMLLSLYFHKLSVAAMSLTLCFSWIYR